MRSVRTKISLTYLLISVVAILFAGWITDLQIERYQTDRVVGELTSHLNTVRSIIQQSGPDGSPARISTLLHEIGRAASIRITLIDDDGRVVFESEMADSLLGSIENHAMRPEVQDARNTGTGVATRFSSTLQSPMMYVAKKVDFAGGIPSRFSPVRFVRTAMSLSEVTAMQSRVRIIIIFSALLTLVIVGLVSAAVSRQISRPIEEMGAVIADVRAGKYTGAVRIRSRDEIGRLSELLNSMVDQLRSDTEQLERLQRVRSQFLANVSHELRTPLFTLKGFLESLLDGGLSDAKVSRRFVEKAYGQANRLDQLLADLIGISRLESGEMKPSLRFFPVQELLRNAVDEFQEPAERKRQTVSLAPGTEVTMVLGDREMLKLVFRNLLDNAVKYCSEGARIVLRAEPRDEFLRIIVQDDGPGIPSEHHNRIFERFYRIDSNRSRDLGGTGLGLAIVKHIVEAHESRIHVASAPGEGTTFWFELKRSH